jgi:RNA polymerase sigma factor (sigma-70 family)
VIDDDRTLAARARRGDARAFGDLVEHHRTSALRVASVVLGHPTGADDVVQDAALRAWRAIRSLDPERGFRPWYLRAVANTARNERRSRGRRAALALRRPTPDLAPDDPETSAITTEERQRVLDALNLLDTDDRLVLALRYFEDLTVAEIAHVLGCPDGTVKSRLSRATARLRGHLTTAEARP